MPTMLGAYLDEWFSQKHTIGSTNCFVRISCRWGCIVLHAQADLTSQAVQRSSHTVDCTLRRLHTCKSGMHIKCKRCYSGIWGRCITVSHPLSAKEWLNRVKTWVTNSVWPTRRKKKVLHDQQKGKHCNLFHAKLLNSTTQELLLEDGMMILVACFACNRSMSAITLSRTWSKIAQASLDCRQCLVRGLLTLLDLRSLDTL